MSHSKFFSILFAAAALVVVPLSFVFAISAKDFSFDKQPTEQQMKELEALPAAEREKLIQEVMKNRPPAPAPTPLPEGTASCYDYYHFQSVQVNMLPDHERYASGDTVTFTGEITNQNTYPIVGGTVFARISKKNFDERTAVDADGKIDKDKLIAMQGDMKKGNDIIDELIPVESLTLAPGEVNKTHFTWVVPKGVVAGDYRIDYYYVVGEKFELSGLPFTKPDIGSGRADFRIDSFIKDGVFFDRAKTAVTKGDTQTIVTQDIKNTSAEPKQATITYELFLENSLNEAGKLNTKTESIVIPAKSSKTLVYTIPERNNHEAYYLHITSLVGAQKSVVNTYVASKGAHLGFTSLTAFPLTQEQEVTLFGCYTTMPSIDGSISVSVSDKSGNEVGKASYSGSIGGPMLAVVQKILPKSDYNFLTLKAEVKDAQGNVVDSYENTYDCATITSEACTNLLTQKSQSSKALGFGIVVVALLVLVGWFIVERRREHTVITNN